MISHIRMEDRLSSKFQLRVQSGLDCQAQSRFDPSEVQNPVPGHIDCACKKKTNVISGQFIPNFSSPQKVRKRGVGVVFYFNLFPQVKIEE